MFCAYNGQAQEAKNNFYEAGFSLGNTFSSNRGFPETDVFKEFEAAVVWDSEAKTDRWAQQLNYPETGLSLRLSDFGNERALGYSISMNPFISFHPLKKNRNLYVKLGGGLGYFNTIFDDVENPSNKGITKNVNITFLTQLNYVLLRTHLMSWKAGMGIIHYSNGHTRLPNQGLNILAFQVSGRLEGSGQKRIPPVPSKPNRAEKRSKTFYLGSRFGFGQNVLSRTFNDKEGVFTAAFSVGKVINNTFKLGVGVNYRFYQHYYNYIKNNEELVQERFSEFKENAFWNATNLGINFSTELLMGHIGAELDIGVNIHKPSYQIDWILNDGFTYLEDDELVTVYGELNNYFKLKRTFPTRLGLKYYAINTNKRPKDNFYLGAHINANLGQADFTEIGLGYVRNL